jgi:hypothetical protein
LRRLRVSLEYTAKESAPETPQSTVRETKALLSAEGEIAGFICSLTPMNFIIAAMKKQLSRIACTCEHMTGPFLD